VMRRWLEELKARIAAIILLSSARLVGALGVPVIWVVMSDDGKTVRTADAD